MLKLIKLVLISLTISFMYSCKGKDGATGPAGVDGTNTKGSSLGYVNLKDEFDNEFSNDKSGIKLTLLGSNPEITVVTDVKGNFAFENVKTGNYDLLIKKEGFPDKTYESFPIFEGPKPLKNFGYLSLRQKSTTELSNLVVSTEESEFGTKVLKFKVKALPVSDQGNGRTILFVFSNNSNVSINDLGTDYYSSNSTTSVSFVTAIGDSATTKFLKYQDTYNGQNGSSTIIESGRRVYCKAYSIAKNDNYNITSDDKRFYATLSSSSSNIASAIVK